MSHRLSAALAVAGLAAVLLTGCATPVGGASPSPAADEPVTQPQEIDAAWLDAGRMIGVVTMGSSTCVPLAESVDAAGQTLTVTLADPEAEACTKDLAPRVTLVPVPEGVDVTQDVDILTVGAVDGRGELDGLDDAGGTPGEETDYLPSAGWTDTDGQFVLLTWGSSTCAPVAETVTASGPAEVTVIFATGPVDQVCTMDMAPRALAVQAPEEIEEDGTFAVLVGAEFDNIRIPILD